MGEACTEAEVFWGNFHHTTPLIGCVNMFNIDQVRTIFLEVTNSEVLRMLSRQAYITWVLIVAPNMASVTMNSSITMDLEGLDELVQIIQAYNKTFKGTKVKDGGYFVDRVVLGKPRLDMHDAHARTQGPRVFWDRFWNQDTRDTYMDQGGNMSNRDTKNDLEVLVTVASSTKPRTRSSTGPSCRRRLAPT